MEPILFDRSRFSEKIFYFGFHLRTVETFDYFSDWYPVSTPRRRLSNVSEGGPLIALNVEYSLQGMNDESATIEQNARKCATRRPTDRCTVRLPTIWRFIKTVTAKNRMSLPFFKQASYLYRLTQGYFKED
jgi:hypothetical protein